MLLAFLNVRTALDNLLPCLEQHLELITFRPGEHLMEERGWTSSLCEIIWHWLALEYRESVLSCC